MTHGEILVNLYWADLYLRTKRDASNSGIPMGPKMSKIIFHPSGITRQTIPSREGLSSFLPSLFIDFEKEFLFTYLKKLRPTSKLYAVQHKLADPNRYAHGFYRGVTRMHESLKALDVPYFVTLSSEPAHQEIIFLNESDSVLGAAALS